MRSGCKPTSVIGTVMLHHVYRRRRQNGLGRIVELTLGGMNLLSGHGDIATVLMPGWIELHDSVQGGGKSDNDVDTVMYRDNTVQHPSKHFFLFWAI